MANKYSVYQHTMPDGKIYIGMTRNDVSKRWSYGNGYIQNKLFYEAIQKVGWNKIQHKVLFSGLSRSEAEYLEYTFIKAYQSNDKEFGYNVSDARTHRGNRFRSQITSGKHIQEWETVDFLIDQIKEKDSQISEHNFHIGSINRQMELLLNAYLKILDKV